MYRYKRAFLFSVLRTKKGLESERDLDTAQREIKIKRKGQVVGTRCPAISHTTTMHFLG